MKIAEIIATFPPYHGGMGYVCYHNALELARRGHDVTVYTLEYNRLSYDNDPDEFKIVRLRTPMIYGDAGIVPQLYTGLKGYDIVHLHYPFFGGAEYVYFASLVRGNKYFLTYHMDVHGNTFLKKLLLSLYEKLFMRRIIQKADLIGALSKAHLTSSKAAKFVDWSKVVEIPNGVDTDAFSPQKKNEALIGKYGLEDKIVVLFVGNLLPLKGLHFLIDAMSVITDDRIVLLVVGGGYSENEYKEQVIKKGLQKKIIFAGPQSHDSSLPEYYNLGDFLVLPSTSEAFPLVVLEAMASGKPAIVSSLPGPSGLVREGVDGFIARVGDSDDLRQKIELLAGRPDLCRTMGEAARQKVLEKYNWERIAGMLERKFEDLLSS
jgi:glycosyltransferase involved in cell wall biosynthesis